MEPLASRIRPKTIDEIVGQTHLLGENMPLRRIIETGQVPNMIFYGPPGTGKTTVAEVITRRTKMQFFKLNGTSSKTADIREVIETSNLLDAVNGVLLYLDEIQYLNKKQQQSLLEFIENGKITLIAATTENPYFAVYSALLSRSCVFEFKHLSSREIIPAVISGYEFLSNEKKKKFEIEDGVHELIATHCGGDVRKSLNIVELSTIVNKKVTCEDIKKITEKSNLTYDRDGDEHYNILSAFQKSLRGSDENAALHYMARLIEAGDLVSLTRRLMVTACEDVGLAYPQIIPIVKSCIDAALMVGLPEARIPLADAVILICVSPKSNSGICAIDAALEDVRNANFGEIPPYLQDGHYSGAEKLGKAIGYKYPHEYPKRWVNQQYLPNELKDKKYYVFGDNKTEQAALAFRRFITDNM